MAPGYHARVRIDTLNCLAAGLLLAACESATPAATPAPAPAGAPPDAAQNAPAAAKPSAAADTAPMAQVREDVPLPLPRLLGRPIEEVQAQLGEHIDKAMLKKPCFRYAPARTHFTCRYAQQVYADKTGNFRSVRIAYEDGIAAAVAYDGWTHGSGTFTPEALLTAIGLTLPLPGTFTEPAPGVKLWSWFNWQARLMIGGKQHRVELSIIEDDWNRSRVEVTMNDPLTPEQQAMVVMVDGKAMNGAKSASESTPNESAPAAPTAP